MSPLEAHIRSLLYSFTLSEILEMCDVEEYDLLQMLIETQVLHLPDFLKMEEPYDGELYLEGTDE